MNGKRIFSMIGVLLTTTIMSLGLGSIQAAENFPTKPISVIVGFGAGGSTDLAMRALANVASKTLGQPIVIENKPGGGGSLSISILAKKNPDGYNLGILNTGVLINQHIRPVNYDTDGDITPIIQFAQYQAGLVVRADSPWKTLNEFLEYAKSKPGGVSYSTAGVGTQQHLVMTRLGEQLGIKWTHVAYKSGPETLFAVEKGEVDASSQTAEWTAAVNDKRLRLLAVYGDTRMKEFPDVATLVESGYKIVAPSLLGIVGPSGMDPEKVEKLSQAFKNAMQDEKFLKITEQFSLRIAHQGPAEFRKTIANVNATWAPIIKQSGLVER